MPLPLLLGIGLGLGALGKGLGIISEQEQARAAAEEAERNRRLTLEAARDAARRGRLAAGLTRMRGSRAAAAVSVAAQHGGIDPTQGLAAEGAALTRAMTEMDALTQENNAARQAYGLGQQAEAYGQQAKRIRQQADMALVGGLLGFAGEGLAAAGQLGAFGASAKAAWAQRYGYDLGNPVTGAAYGVEASLSGGQAEPEAFAEYVRQLERRRGGGY